MFQISAATLIVWTARGLRGRSHPADVIFAVLYLHLGHGLNWLMGYQLGFGLLAYSVAGWIWTAGRLARGGGRGWAWLSVAYCVPILLCGGFGIALIDEVMDDWRIEPASGTHGNRLILRKRLGEPGTDEANEA